MRARLRTVMVSVALFSAAAYWALLWSGPPLESRRPPPHGSVDSAEPVAVPPGAEKAIADLCAALQSATASLSEVSAAGLGVSPGNVSSEPVTDWLEYPRTTFTLGWYLARMGDDAGARVLVRNVHLNPTDTPIPAAMITQLDVIFRSIIVPRVTQFQQAHVQASIADVSAMQEQLPWKAVVTSSKLVSRKGGGAENLTFLALPTEGPTHVYMTTADGGYVSVEQNRLPSLAALKRARSFFISELGSALVTWFIAVGVCDSERANDLRAEVFGAADDALR